MIDLVIFMEHISLKRAVGSNCQRSDFGDIFKKNISKLSQGSRPVTLQ